MTKVKGPKDGDKLSAVFNGKENGKKKCQFSSLSNTKDLVLLSIQGNEYCTGSYLGALLDYTTTTHQKKPDKAGSEGKSTFLVADEIYWHNLKELPPQINVEEELKAQALEIGNQYIQDNLEHFLKPFDMSKTEFKAIHGDISVDNQIDIINKMAIAQNKNFEIMRWHTWVNQEGANEQIKSMIPYYESEPGLRISLDEDIDNFALRHKHDPEGPELWRYRSHGYLTEESPSIMWLAALLDYNFIIYPGKMLSTFSATKDFFIVKNHRPTVFDGKSVEDVCTHNSLSLHTPNPDRLVNWLEPDFVRSFTVSPKKPKAPSLFNHSFYASADDNKPDYSGASSSAAIPVAVIERNPPAKQRSTSTTLLIDVDTTAHAVSDSQQYEVIADLFSSVLLALSTDRAIKPAPADPRDPPANLVELFQKFAADLLQIDISTSEKLSILSKISGSLATLKETETAGIRKHF